jgi:hypothetical protein
VEISKKEKKAGIKSARSRSPLRVDQKKYKPLVSKRAASNFFLEHAEKKSQIQIVNYPAREEDGDIQ